MAKPDDTSTRRPVLNEPEQASAQTSTSTAASTSAASVAPRIPYPDIAPLSLVSLKATIDAERAQLMRAQAVIKCLSAALLYLEDDESTSYVDTANVAVDLIDQCVSRLEGIGNRAFEHVDDSKPLSVKEPRPAYLC